MKRHLLIMIAAALLLVSCAGGKQLRAEHEAKEVGVQGPFTLIMLGAKNSNDLETVAFFDVEGDDYDFELFAPEFRYEIIEGLSSKEAMKKALHHVSFHSALSGTWLKRILNEKGQVIGYELRPLYMPIVYGAQDVLEVRYILGEGGKVRVYTELKGRVERSFSGDGDDRIFGK